MFPRHVTTLLYVFPCFSLNIRYAHFRFCCTQPPCLTYVPFVFSFLVYPTACTTAHLHVSLSCTRRHQLVFKALSCVVQILRTNIASYSNTACLIRLRLCLSSPLSSTLPASGSTRLPFTPDSGSAQPLTLCQSFGLQHTHDRLVPCTCRTWTSTSPPLAPTRLRTRVSVRDTGWDCVCPVGKLGIWLYCLVVN